MIRYATVKGNGLTIHGLKAYLPSNYRVIGEINEPENAFVIAGTDYAGWTMDDYVIPRLGSGLIWAKELVEKT